MSDIVFLSEDTPAIKYLCKKDKRFAKIFSLVGTISYCPYEDGFEFLVHEIIEQMLSQKAAQNIFSRLKALCNNIISPSSLSETTLEEIKSTGTSTAKAQYILNLTEKVQSGELVLNDLCRMSDLEVIQRLTSLKGIGLWTAKMYLIFVLDRQDMN